ncbi:zinc-dependent alcohol dehydrogenase family protein [Nocardioides sp. STR2]|uniref:alcohol dehydrogenase n=1 Tax=Nocardioides pini TaxID=2975053 RepID=A0ABT4CBL0_9ACTN|nr:zinc-dependent alcohol dehydrogenase family protein [Nocardioides pini]MCY4726352.1 zinc-dependent alcohol dehydrogenase family protein [Nocardioides pini]
MGGRPGTLGRLEHVDLPEPEPGADELLVRVRSCGVCRTDLHLADRELEPRAPRRVPGHEIVGEVVDMGPRVHGWRAGDRAGVAWLRSTCGTCRWCRSDRENLCRSSLYTGWDADGGFAEYAVVPAAFAYALPDDLADEVAGPLLCSGIIGYRALRRSGVRAGDHLGLYGFGASAHLTAQVALAWGVHVHAVSRESEARALALELGADWAGDVGDEPPVPLDGAILFAPVGEMVPPALRALDQGATLAIACIHLTDIPSLDYQADLFRERSLTSVTANTRQDGRELLALAGTLGIRPRVTTYGLDRTDQALDDLASGRVTGAAVVRVS